jgi:hypothetical protein
MFSEAWRRLTSPFREFGGLAGALYIGDRLLQRLSPALGLYFYEFVVQPVSAKPLLPAGLSRNLSAAEIGPGHPDLALMPARSEIKQQRFEQGARCVATYRKGELIGYLWYATPRYHEDEVRCTYVLDDAARSVFDFDVYVMPSQRAGIAFSGIWQNANQHLASQGIAFSFSRVSRFNLASRRAHARLGARTLGWGVFLRLGPLELMTSSLAPYVSMTLGRHRRVTLHLRP